MYKVSITGTEGTLETFPSSNLDKDIILALSATNLAAIKTLLDKINGGTNVSAVVTAINNL